MSPTHSRQIKRMTAKNGTKLLKPAIGLKRLDKGDEGKQDNKMKCCTNPGEADSTTYKIPMAYFRDGTPEEWLLFKKTLTRCITGQNVTSRPTKYSLARRLLSGCAMADFNHAATANGDKFLAY